MNRTIANIISFFIPNKEARHNFRKKHTKSRINHDHINTLNMLKEIEMKLATKDDIYYLNNIKFYLPFYPVDLIQKVIVNDKLFFEQNVLEDLNNELNFNKNTIIFDIGANIGNHSIYWAIINGVKKVYSFEPIKRTFDVLAKNVELNNLADKIIINNFGLGKNNSTGSISKFYMDNIGGTSIKEDPNGDLKIFPLDEYVENNFKDNYIDFIKIDVEGFEYDVLLGAKKTLDKYKPKIFIEIFREDDIEKTDKLLKDYGYHKLKDYQFSNFLYEHD